MRHDRYGDENDIYTLKLNEELLYSISYNNDLLVVRNTTSKINFNN